MRGVAGPHKGGSVRPQLVGGSLLGVSVGIVLLALAGVRAIPGPPMAFVALGFVIAAFSLGLGVLTLVQLMVVAIREALESRYWASTTGTVVARDFNEYDSGDEQSYSVSVVYAYTVAGRQYTGTRIRLTTRVDTLSRLDADDVGRLKHGWYDVGSTVAVHYDPGNPARAVLERDAGWMQLLVVIAGLLVVLAILVSVASPLVLSIARRLIAPD